MRSLGVNTITLEVRPTSMFVGSPSPPDCLPSFNFGGIAEDWPQPSGSELSTLGNDLDLAEAAGLQVVLQIVNNHMDEQPPVNVQNWLSQVLSVARGHPALYLILFDGNVNKNPDGSCAIPAEPPLWLGIDAIPAQYVKWAIGFAMSLGFPSRMLSAEAIVGDYVTETQPPFTDPIVTEQTIFDQLDIPAAERTYVLSYYEHNKCATAQGLTCADEDQYQWSDDTFAHVAAITGAGYGGNGARVYLDEMGDGQVSTTFQSERAVESLNDLNEQYGFEGGSFWQWENAAASQDTDPAVANPVIAYSSSYTFFPVVNEIIDAGGFHLTSIPDGSFEDCSSGSLADWTVNGSGSGACYFLAGEPNEPQVPNRGSYDLRLTTGSSSSAQISASSGTIEALPETSYTTTGNFRFTWTGDPNPSGDPATRPQVFVAIHYFAGASPSAIRAEDVFRYFQENGASDFQTIPIQYTTPSDATAVEIEVGAARNSLASPIVFDVDNLR